MRPERESSETEVSVTGHRAGMVEPQDQGRSQESAEIAGQDFAVMVAWHGREAAQLLPAARHRHEPL